MSKKNGSKNAHIWLRSLGIGLAAYAVMFILLAAVISPEQYDIKVGLPAPVTIFATKDVEDTVTTQKLRDGAAANAEVSYRAMDTSVVSHVVSELNSRFSALKDLSGAYTEEQIAGMTDADVSALSAAVGVPLDRNMLLALQTYPAEDIDSAFSSARSLVRDALDSTLPEGQQDAAVSKIQRDMLDDYDPALVNLSVAAVRASIQPNMLIDEETTELNREKARQGVEAQICVKGEVIVREGDIVTTAQHAMLLSLGLIEDSSYDVLLISGIALLLLLLMLALALYLYIYARGVLTSPRRLLLLAIVMVLVIVVSIFARAVNTYLMPVALGLMLVGSLIDQKLSLFVNLILGVLTSLLASASAGFFSMAMFSIVIMTVVSGPVVVFIMERHMQRTSILLAGVAVGLVNFLITIAVGLINSASVAAVFINAAWAAGGGILAAIVCIGTQPLMEWMFNLVTNAKLLELSNPNQPLLHRLLLEAPGTYHHSIIVANLAEAAAAAVGANPLLARVGAYYHDVGKLKRPMYFAENQLGDNPHDRTDPRVSTAILTAHTRDGAQMAGKEHLPPEIIEIINQHHGDSPVLYFYDKAKKLYGEDVDISTFRYEGPRPARREAAIVMLADIIEAATRSMPSHEPKKIAQFIRKLVRDKMIDGQLDKSQLTFGDLDNICEAFITVLSGVFHERIEYPDVKLPPRAEEATKDDSK